jgi:hypothetical protein|tara:strand:- start:4209 stop:4466 length:258 start_codon:yes stop_codon:yes gene_type:complete
MNIYRVAVHDGHAGGWKSWFCRTKKEALKDARREARGAKGLTGEWEVIVHAIKVGTGKDAIIDALNDASQQIFYGEEIFSWNGDG